MLEILSRALIYLAFHGPKHKKQSDRERICSDPMYFRHIVSTVGSKARSHKYSCMMLCQAVLIDAGISCHLNVTCMQFEDKCPDFQKYFFSISFKIKTFFSKNPTLKNPQDNKLMMSGHDRDKNISDQDVM